MSELFERLNKLIPYDPEIVSYICDLAEYHPGFYALLESFIKKFESNQLRDDNEFLLNCVDSLEGYLDSLYALQDDSTSNEECFMYDSLFVMGVYSVVDGYINSGILCDKLEYAIGDNAIDELSAWAQKNPCSYYYGGSTVACVPASEYEKIYFDILSLQARVSTLYHNSLFPFFKGASEKCGISYYAPQYYENLKNKYSGYYKLYPSQGIVMHNNHVFDVRLNTIIKMDLISQSILKKCFERTPDYLLSNSLSYLQKLLNSGCICHTALEKRLSHLYDKRKQQDSIKGVLHLELTHKCNLNCKHCFNRTVKRNPDIDSSEWLSVIDQFAHFGKYYTILFGGEPTLYKEIERILAKLVSVDFPIELFTNATLIDKSYAQMLGKYNLSKIKVSIDGDNSLRGVGSFEKAMRGLDALTRYSNAPVYVNVTICDNNIAELESIVRMCKELRADGIGFAPMQSMGNASINNLHEIDVSSEVDVTQFIIELGKKYNINVGMERFCEGPFDIFRSKDDELYTRATPCDFGVAMYYVRSDGLLAFCPDLSDERFAVDLTDDNIEKAGCNGIEKLRYPTEICSKCTLFYMCFGSCKATIFRKHKSFEYCDESNRKRIELTLDSIIKKYEGINQ